MKLFGTAAHRSDGRLQGTYVYLILCQNDADIFAKIGVSGDPIKRITELCVGCPFEPGVLAIVELSSRERAFSVETRLHAALKAWHLKGEWFCFVMADKPRFNEISRTVLSEYASPSWPLAWTKIDARELMRQRYAARHAATQLSIRERNRFGKAQRDFRRHSKRK